MMHPAHRHVPFRFMLLLAFPLWLGACKPGRDVTANEQHHPPKEKNSIATTKSNGNTGSNTANRRLEEKYAGLLGVPADNIRNTRLYSFIDDWYGVPYKYGGQNRKGIDCSNFAATLYATIYNKQLKGSSAAIFNQCKVVPKNDLQEGDLLFFRIDKDGISHVAVYLQNDKFVHATVKKGVMIDDLDEPYYKKYFYRAGRLPE